MRLELAKRVRDECLAALARTVDEGDKTACGVLEIYAGRQPKSADEGIRVDKVWDHTLLARMMFYYPAFGTPVNGTIIARPLAAGLALAEGKATWARVYDRDGRSVIDLDIAEHGAALNFDDTELHEGQMLQIDGFELSLPSSS